MPKPADGFRISLKDMPMHAVLRKFQAALNALRIGRNACRALWCPGLKSAGSTIAVSSTEVLMLRPGLPRSYVLIRARSLLRRISEGHSDGNLPITRYLLSEEAATDHKSAAAHRHLVGG